MLSLLMVIQIGGGGGGSRLMHGFFVLLFGNPISWSSQQQYCVAASTCHAEYIALGVAITESAWFQNLLMDIFQSGICDYDLV